MRKTLIAAAAACTLFLGSCLGPFNAFNSISEWNGNLSETKWVNELAFLGLNIIPVYGVAMLGDALIFNSIEFWGGENPIAPAGDFTNQSEL